MVAQVNEVGISQQEYEAEISRFEAAQSAAGIDLATLGDYRSRILEALIDQELLVQGALVNDLQVEQASLEAKIEQLISDSGGEEAYRRWLAENNYEVESFRQALQREMMAANMVQEIVAGLPPTIEHVHARHVLVASQEQAEQVLAQLQEGAEFGELARSLSLDLSTRAADGDLGWFARGGLTIPEVEIAAFEQGPGEISGIIQSELGFHIVETLERADRMPTSAARQRQREAAVEAWLSAAREAAEIEIFLAP